MTEANTWSISVSEHMVHTTVDSSASGHITSYNVSASASLVINQASRMSDLVDETTRAMVVEVLFCPHFLNPPFLSLSLFRTLCSLYLSKISFPSLIFVSFPATNLPLLQLSFSHSFIFVYINTG